MHRLPLSARAAFPAELPAAAAGWPADPAVWPAVLAGQPAGPAEWTADPVPYQLQTVRTIRW